MYMYHASQRVNHYVSIPQSERSMCIILAPINKSLYCGVQSPKSLALSSRCIMRCSDSHTSAHIEWLAPLDRRGILRSLDCNKASVALLNKAVRKNK